MTKQTRIGRTATSIYTEDGYTRIRYHSTEVVKFNEKEVILNSGRWRTATTKNRMNQASRQFDLGYSVFQRNFIWYVRYIDEEVEFYDGIVLNLPNMNQSQSRKSW